MTRYTRPPSSCRCTSSTPISIAAAGTMQEQGSTAHMLHTSTLDVHHATQETSLTISAVHAIERSDHTKRITWIVPDNSTQENAPGASRNAILLHDAQLMHPVTPGQAGACHMHCTAVTHDSAAATHKAGCTCKHASRPCLLDHQCLSA